MRATWSLISKNAAFRAAGLQTELVAARYGMNLGLWIWIDKRFCDADLTHGRLELAFLIAAPSGLPDAEPRPDYP
jgi:hypothetical protein